MTYYYERELGFTEEYSWEKDTPEDRRSSKWKEQRKKYGFDEREIWGLYISIASFLYPRLKFFMEFGCSYPMGMTHKEWQEILGKMVFAFEKILIEDVENNRDKINEGLNLFRKYYFNLWD